MDGQQGDGNAIQLIDDGQRHSAEVYCSFHHFTSTKHQLV
jgi:hypothetical protein